MTVKPGIDRRREGWYQSAVMHGIQRIVDSRYTIWALLAAPFVYLLVAYRGGDLFYGEVLHISGELSARLMMVTLAVTPLGTMFPKARWPRWLLGRRRYLGVATFAYAMLHTLVYVDRQEELAAVLQDGLAFEYWTGWVALLIFIALALTSNDRAVRALKKSWKRLHRWVYVAAVLSFAHWIFIAFDFVPALIHLAIIAALEAYRVRANRAVANRA